MNRPQCIITGCSLRTGFERWNGDLFELGDVYIFNANPNSRHDASEPPFYSKELSVADCFERRAVFVVAKSAASLNDEALAYIEQWSPKS